MAEASDANHQDLLFRRFQLRGEDGSATIYKVVGMKPETESLVLEVDRTDDYLFLSVADFNARLVQRPD